MYQTSFKVNTQVVAQRKVAAQAQSESISRRVTFGVVGAALGAVALGVTQSVQAIAMPEVSTRLDVMTPEKRKEKLKEIHEKVKELEKAGK